jgi:hypothetical protein
VSERNGILPIENYEVGSHGNFAIRLVKFKDPVLDMEIFGYGIFNRVTGVQEAECRREWTARLIAQKFHEDMIAGLPTAPVIDPEVFKGVH